MEEIPGFAAWTAGTYADFMSTDNVYPRGVPTWITSGENAGRVKVGDGVTHWSQLPFQDADLWTAIDAVGGKGGFLDPHDFGTATPSMEALLAYACPDIWDAGGVFTYNSAAPSASTYVIYGVTHTAAEIFSGTSVINTYNGLNDEWKLANTPNTTPPVFSWINLGEGTVGPASELYEGVAKLATAAEALAGANDTKIMTPLKVKQAINAGGGGGGGIIPTTAPSANPPAGSASIWASGAAVEPPFIGIRYPNGTLKYIYGGSGPIPPPPSSSYITLNNGTTVPITAADLNGTTGLCGNGGPTTQITVGGQSVVKNTIVGAVFSAAEFGNVTAIPNYFCMSFSALTSIDLSGFTGLQSIGDYFLTYDISVNAPLTIPASVTSIGDRFLYECLNMTALITVETPATNFTTSIYSFSGSSTSDPAYATGMMVGGTYGADMRGPTGRFPDRTLPPFRKLIADTPPPPPPPPSNSYLTLAGGGTVPITAADLTSAGLCNAGNPSTAITVGGQSVVKNTIVGAVFSAAEFSGVTAIPDYFCLSFNALASIDLSGFTGLQSIGNYFLADCSVFNQALSLSGITSIGFGFLADCLAFNQPLTIPASVNSIGTEFLNDCNNMTSLITVETPAGNFAASPSSFAVTSTSYPAYATGMRIGGTYEADVIARFPNSTSSPYRKLIADTPPPPPPPPSNSYLTLSGGGTVLITEDDLTSTGLCSNGIPTSTITVGGQTVVKNTIVGAVFNAQEFSGVQAIGDNFCFAFTALTSIDLSGFTGLQSIGKSFLSWCTAFNQPITVPANVTSIGSEFLYQCNNMVSLITVETPATNFSTGGDDSFSVADTSVPAYATGMRVGGTYGAAVKARFPDRTSIPYRKLVVPSYLTLNNGTTVPITADDLTSTGLCNGGLASTAITVGGQSVVKNTIVGAVFAAAEFGNVQTIPNNFCMYFIHLTALDLSGFTGLQSIGNYFLYYCSQFNQPLTIPANVTGIGQNFLNMCDNMTSLITVETPAASFAASPNSFAVSSTSVPAYATGMIVGGTYGADVIAAFPNSASAPYRKLVGSYLTLQDGSRVPITAADLPSPGLCNSSSPITIGGAEIAKSTIVGAVFSAAEFGNVTAIPDSFCRYFIYLTSIDLSGFTGVTSIGDSFLSGNVNLSGPLTLPPNIQTIGNYFLSGCTVFNHAFTLPESVTGIGGHFLYECQNMTSLITVETPATNFAQGDDYSFAVSSAGAPAYDTGMRVGGIYGTAVKAAFPDRSTSEPFRKLIADAPPASGSYLTLADGTTILITEDDLPNLCNTDETVTINGQTINKDTITGAVFNAAEFSGVTAIPNYFCMSFSALTSIDLSGFTGLQSIGDYFLISCTAFNQPLTIPSSVTSIGTFFLFQCRNMTSLITI